MYNTSITKIINEQKPFLCIRTGCHLLAGTGHGVSTINRRKSTEPATDEEHPTLWCS